MREAGRAARTERAQAAKRGLSWSGGEGDGDARDEHEPTFIGGARGAPIRGASHISVEDTRLAPTASNDDETDESAGRMPSPEEMAKAEAMLGDMLESVGLDYRQVLASSSERSDHHERLGGEDLFKSAPDLVLKKFAEAELGDRMEKSEKSATLGADPKVEKKEKKKSFFGKKKEGGDGKELV